MSIKSDGETKEAKLYKKNNRLKWVKVTKNLRTEKMVSIMKNFKDILVDIIKFMLWQSKWEWTNRMIIAEELIYK